MARKFSKKSLERLRTCHDDLQLLCHSILEDMDITVLCGHRTKEEQEAAFKAGNSRLQFPKSKHNSMPSLAVDIAPVKNGKVDWNDIKLFEKMCKIAEQKAEKLGIEIILGRDFKTLKDYPHIELASPKK